MTDNSRVLSPDSGNTAKATPIAEGYTLQIDYDQSIEDGRKAGKYDWENSENITSENFPTTRKGKVTIVLQLIHFDREVNSDSAITELNKMGLRPAETHELLALGAAYPEVQCQFPIVALGSTWQGHDRESYVPALHKRGSKRFISLVWFVSGWSMGWHFAAVPK